MTKRHFLVLAAPSRRRSCLAGCAGDAGGDSSGAQRRDRRVTIETIQLAASNTEAAESISDEIDVQGGDVPSMHADGVTSADGKTGQTVVETPKGRFEQRIVDGVAYFDLSASTSLAVDLERPRRNRRQAMRSCSTSTASATSSGRTRPERSADSARETPDSALGMLQQLSGDVEQVGDDTVAGRHAVQLPRRDRRRRRRACRSTCGSTPRAGS